MTGRPILRRVLLGVGGCLVLVFGGGCETLLDLSYPVPATYGCGGDATSCAAFDYSPPRACPDGCARENTCLANDCGSPELASACSAALGCERSETLATSCVPTVNAEVQCASLKDETPCVSRPDCRWGLHCTGVLEPCKAIMDQAACQATPTCFWHRNAG